MTNSQFVLKCQIGNLERRFIKNMFKHYKSEKLSKCWLAYYYANRTIILQINDLKRLNTI